MKANERRQATRVGFTLVELLIVISIIGILMGLLFPAMSAALDAAASLGCRNNLGQIAQAAKKYAYDHQGYIVPALEEVADGSGSRWANILVMQGYIEAPNIKDKSDGDVLDQDTILLCPSTTNYEAGKEDNPAPSDDEALGWYRVKSPAHEVACSYYWNGSEDKDFEDFRQFPSMVIPSNPTSRKMYLHHLSEIQQQTSFVMAMDGTFTYEEDKQGRIAARHRGEYGPRCRTNIAFYDGHVEEYQWTRDPTAADPDTEAPDPLWAAPDKHMHSVGNYLSGGTLIFRLDDQIFTSTEGN